MTTIGSCYCQRTVGDKTSEETRYFIGSKAAGARYYGKALRNHWRIENSLYWQLDVSFREDSNREQGRKAAANLALIHGSLGLALIRPPSRQRLLAQFP